ncbi:MAG TPA: hypothetical protein VGA51_01930 [Casimicrobiaceae bacterium]
MATVSHEAGVGERVQVLRVRGRITIEQIERVLKERRNRTI